MVKKYFLSLFAFVFSLLAISTIASDFLRANEAGKFIGERKTVCGEVAQYRFSAQSNGSPTFINLDEPFPNQIFTVVVWGRDKERVGPDKYTKGKSICVEGTIAVYDGIPQIVIRNSEQIWYAPKSR